MISSIWLRDLASYSLQIALLISAGALLARLFQLRTPTATLAYWQTLLVACLLLPVCQPWKESVVNATLETATQISGAPSLHAAASEGSGSTPGSKPWPVQETVLLMIGAGIAVRGVWLAAGFWSLRRFRRESSILSPGDKIRAATVRRRTFRSRDSGSACMRTRLLFPSVAPLLERAQQRLGVHADFYASDKTAMPITFGLLRPVILLPLTVLEMEPQTQEAIIYHELLHVRRRDWVHSVLEECIRTILWFHPAIWWLIGRIHLTREQAVDHAVIQLTESREQYVEALLEVARAKTLPKLTPATLFLRKALLKKRVAEIFKETTMSKRRLVSCLVISSCALLLAAGTAVWMFPLEARGEKSKSAPIQVLKGEESLLHRAPLEYPRRAIEKRIEGDVALEVSVDEQGLVSDARVLSGPEELRRAALQSVLRWHYAPSMRGSTQVLIHFQLPQEGASNEFHGSPHEYPFGSFLPGDTEEGKKTGLTPAQLVERQIEEIQSGLADPNSSAEHKAELRHKLAELKAMVEGIQANNERFGLHLERFESTMTAGSEEEKKRGLSAAQRVERQIEEIRNALADPNTSAEQKAELKHKLAELKEQMERIRTERREKGPINGKLKAIRTERVSDAALNMLLPRLALHVGDVIDEASAQRIRETVSSVDEHFRTVFHREGEGGITLVIVGP